MIAEGIDKIQSLVRLAEERPTSEKHTLTIDGDRHEYDFKLKVDEHGREIGEILTPPRPAKLTVSTLTGFVDAVHAGVGGTLSRLALGDGSDPAKGNDNWVPLPDAAKSRIVHVEDYLTVSVKSALADKYGVRDTLLTAKHEPVTTFKFDDYYTDPAKFIIALQLTFLTTDDLLYIQKIASSMKAGDTVHVQDDGIGQTIDLRSGEVEVKEHKVKSRVKLIHQRTFPECNDVESEYLLRVKAIDAGGQKVPGIALFDVDGGRWKGHQMRSIKKYLAEHLPTGVPILA